MKTSVNALRSSIQVLEERASWLYGKLRQNSTRTKIRELGGGEMTLSGTNEDFCELYNEYRKVSEELIERKRQLNKLNNTHMLSVGVSISDALVAIRTKRGMLTALESLNSVAPFTRRRSDGSMSAKAAYYEVTELNFDPNKMMEDCQALRKEIDELELEIATLNAAEVDV